MKRSFNRLGKKELVYVQIKLLQIADSFEHRILPPLIYQTEPDNSLRYHAQIIENSSSRYDFYQEHFTSSLLLISENNSRDLATEPDERITLFPIKSPQQTLLPLSCFIKITNKLHDSVARSTRKKRGSIVSHATVVFFFFFSGPNRIVTLSNRAFQRTETSDQDKTMEKGSGIDFAELHVDVNRCKKKKRIRSKK